MVRDLQNIKLGIDQQMGDEEELDLLAGVQIQNQKEVSLVKPNNPDLLSRAADLF